MEMPLFPLSTIVMPGGLLPLRLFERRYIDMVKNCFRNDTGFAVCLVKDGGEDGSPATPYPCGTEVSLVDFDQGADGLLQVTAKGVREVDVSAWSVSDTGLLIGQVEPVDPAVPLAMTEEYESLAQKLELILRYVEPDIQYADKALDDADWVCHRLLELLPLAPPAKYELLQMDSNRERLDTLTGLQIEIKDR